MDAKLTAYINNRIAELMSNQDAMETERESRRQSLRRAGMSLDEIDLATQDTFRHICELQSALSELMNVRREADLIAKARDEIQVQGDN